MKVIRADQTESTTEMQQLSGATQIKDDEIPDLTFEKAVAKYDEMILDMVRKHTGFTLGRLGEEIPKSQSVNAKGKKLDAEMVLQVLDTMQIEFYPDGRPHELHVVGGLFNRESLEAVNKEIQNNPELQRRYDELFKKKREEWCVREANRKLVG